MTKRLYALLLCCFLLMTPLLAQATGLHSASYLADKESQQAVFTRLADAGVPEHLLAQVGTWIDHYNATMKDLLPHSDSFADSKAGDTQRIDFAALYRAWWDANDHYDTLCRLFAFALLGNAVQAANPVPRDAWDVAPMVVDDRPDEEGEIIDEGGWLQSDMDIINEGQFVTWDEKTLERYFSVFDSVPAEGTMTKEAMITAIQRAWADHGVSIEGGNLSLITVWAYNASGGMLGVAHAGLLLEDEQGLLFIEKSDPLYPYQATRYPDLAALESGLRTAIQTTYEGFGEEAPLMAIFRNTIPLLPD